ncbi:hypothetical protein AXG93_2787s1020 [Marchantia polymorpha subsp. ruderalis]|uniref:Uncharacterized protein n=1 Tax=Marchantia polymorpha subsp. ruderalis TaxID=1480154 RepID=A0A176VWL4_MARPO|nr:hypothetical protein AXG93_2787s1020 [Marchantia polymorpha subsp. ruderalis]
MAHGPRLREDGVFLCECQPVRLPHFEYDAQRTLLIPHAVFFDGHQLLSLNEGPEWREDPCIRLETTTRTEVGKGLSHDMNQLDAAVVAHLFKEESVDPCQA